MRASKATAGWIRIVGWLGMFASLPILAAAVFPQQQKAVIPIGGGRTYTIPPEHTFAVAIACLVISIACMVVGSLLNDDPDT